MANYEQKKAKREQLRKKEAYRTQPFFVLAPLIAILAFIPLITYYYKYDTNLSGFSWYTATETAIDFFLYYKMVFVLIACGCMILFLVYLAFFEEKKLIFTKALIPLAVYGVLSLISACLSENSYFSFHGIYEQFEPVWALLGYCMIAYYAFYILRTEADIARTMKWFMVGIILTVLLGLSQVFYHDFFRTEFAKMLITPSEYWSSGNLEFKFEEGRPYLSVYNPNYVGYYVAMVIPILIAVLLTAKKLWAKIGCGVLIASLLLILFASQSRAGIIALIGSLIVMLVCMRKVFLKNWKISVSILVVAAAAFIVVNVLNQNILLNRLMTMFDTTEETYALQSIETNDDNVTITYNDETISFYLMQDEEADYDLFTLIDGDGAQVSYQYDADASRYTIDDARFPFSFASIRSDSFNGFTVIIEDYNWYFTNLMKDGDSTFYAYGGSGALTKLTKQESTIEYLENHYHLANGRGYIWAKTLPLLKKYFWFGSGPDTFIIAFPNDDWVGLYNSSHINEIVTKPHCLYLQIAVQTGVPSLIAWLVFFGWYVVSSIKLYWKNDFTGYLPKFGIAALTAVVSFLIMGLTNDSCVTVTPIFFAIAGMGLGINHTVKAQQKEA